MIKPFRFKIKIYDKDRNYYLRIRPFFIKNNINIRKMYPIDFSELNVLLFIKGENYFLDFENSFDENGNAYGKAYFNRSKQKMILSDLEKEADPFILDFLQGDTTLLKKDKLIKFITDDGLSLKKSFRYGNPKTGKGLSGIKRAKKIFD